MTLTTKNTDTVADLEHLANATDYTEKRLIEFELLENNPLIERLTRAVMTALIGTPWIDENQVSNNYSAIRGEVKDAIISKIMRHDLQELAAIESVSRQWSEKKVRS